VHSGSKHCLLGFSFGNILGTLLSGAESNTYGIAVAIYFRYTSDFILPPLVTALRADNSWPLTIVDSYIVSHAMPESDMVPTVQFKFLPVEGFYNFPEHICLLVCCFLFFGHNDVDM
jgi:hypothetical protein